MNCITIISVPTPHAAYKKVCRVSSNWDKSDVFWKNKPLSGETNIELYGSNSAHVWRKWALRGIRGNMSGAMYQDILEENLISSAKTKNLGRQWKFQQDNNPKHTAKITQDGLSCLSQSPDFFWKCMKDFEIVIPSEGPLLHWVIEDDLPRGMRNWHILTTMLLQLPLTVDT